ncbi:MAG: SDR family NAD(P)-dependent oxidoreductase [Deltaproteobacteria bacterium]|nr:SDR family NAD(P)-dependent oxidoreductase [Deltaproteobacteria bacterium]
MPTSLVTGASRGLGRETVRQLAARGHRVLATARAPRDPGVLPLDVTSEASVRALADRLRGASVDVLVNNAGIALHGFDERVARETIDTNFFGALRVTEALLPLMPRDGVVVMVSSGMGELSSVSPERRAQLLAPDLDVAGVAALMREFVDDVARGRHAERGWPSSAYRVSKVGMNALTRVLARLHPTMKINAVCPGWVRTDLGGQSAPRDVEEGAASIVWAATVGPDGPTGGFFRDGRPIEW